jgi:ATP-dependent Clp protease adaptor protein ClpS
MSKTEIITKIKPNLKISEPSFYNVFYINDDVTTMEFVVESLIQYFNHSEDSALELTTNIHNEGKAIVATLPYEVAEQKGIEVTIDARKNGFPLEVQIKAD